MTKDNIRVIAHGFKKDGKVYLQHCPKCDKENYALSVNTGICCWCGYNANEEEKQNDKQ